MGGGEWRQGAEVEDGTRLKHAAERSNGSRSSRVAERPTEELRRTDELPEVVARPNRELLAPRVSSPETPVETVRRGTQTEDNGTRASSSDDADLCNAKGRDLRGRDFTGAEFRGSGFVMCGSQRGEACGASLVRANAPGADFSGANIRGARLRHGDFGEATFRDADMSETVLTSANLSGADLRNVSFRCPKCPPTQCARELLVCRPQTC